MLDQHLAGGVRARLLPSQAGAISIAWPQIARPAPELIISPCARVYPDSNIHARFNASSRVSSSSAKARQIFARCSGDMRGQGPSSNAALAAATAASASTAPGAGTVATTSSVEGITTSIVPVPAGSTHSPR